MSYIVVKNTADQPLEKSVSDMADMYADTGFTSPIALYKTQTNDYVIRFPNLPDFERFSYFVNYLAYPIDIPDYTPKVFGVWNIQEKIKHIDAAIGATIGLYLSENEEEFDNVYIINSSSKIYKYTFYLKVFEKNEVEVKYETILAPLGATERYKEISPSEKALKALNKPWWKFW